MAPKPLLLPSANEIGTSHKWSTFRADVTSIGICVEMENSRTRLHMHGAHKHHKFFIRNKRLIVPRFTGAM